MAGWFAPGRGIELDHNDRQPSTPSIMETPAEEEVEAVVSTPVQTPAVVRKATATKKYYIVVGSFKIEDNATTLAAELKAEGMDVSILPGSLMKVGIGNYLSREAAKQDLSQIQSSINQHAWIYAY
jgi:cell division protein FtsN